MKILHITAECYPAAKVGGLADVVGAIPKYMEGVDVIMPKYGTKWFSENDFETVDRYTFWYPDETIHYSIQKLISQDLGFPLYVVDIPGKFDRDGIYSDTHGYFADGAERWMCFQRAVLSWLCGNLSYKYDVLHLHDHHTGLVPFMVNYSYDYAPLKECKTIFTIHNLAYQGTFGWDRQYLLAAFDNWKSGLLDWNHEINPIASAVRCADWVTTVSPSYLEELAEYAGGLEWLFQSENQKCSGILNGIDLEVWNPETDPYLTHRQSSTLEHFKLKNKVELCKQLTIKPANPVISFIGRMVEQKGADMLAMTIHQVLSNNLPVNFVVLGTGDPYLQEQFSILHEKYPANMGISLSYNEGLAHQIYASSDFLIMPSRHEPCGLNQMYAMRYGTIPIVHNTGGLIDSVVSYERKKGTGIKFDELSVVTIFEAVQQAIELFKHTSLFNEIRNNCALENFSWEVSSEKYKSIYESLND